MNADAVVIFNPVAGRGLGERLAPRIEAGLGRLFPALVVLRTTAPGDAIRLAREWNQSGVVIAVGGDGTVREVASGLVGGAASMAIVPVGSGNDLLKTLETGTDIDAACRRARHGRPRLLDVVRVTVRDDAGERELHYANAAGIGFDAAVTAETRKSRRLRGLPLYAVAVYRTVANLHCPMARITADGRTWEQRILLAAVANGKYYGGGMKIAPDAEPDDGLLEVCIIEKVSRLFVMRKLPAFVSGTHVCMRQVTMLRLNEFALELLEPAPFQLDGDLLSDGGIASFRFEVLSRALTVLV